MASVLNMIRLLKDQSPIGEECTLCDNVFSLGDAAQIFGRGDSLKAYCLECQEEKAEEKGLEIRIHEGKGSSSTTEKKSRKEGKKKRRKSEKNDKIKRGEKKLEIPTSSPSKIEEAEEETEYLSGDEIVDLVQAGMDKLKVHFDKVLEDAFQFLQSPATGEFPELPIGENTLIREIARGIWNDQWFNSQQNTKNGRLEAHSLPDEELNKCPATTASGSNCQNKPKAGMVYCGSHKAHEDYDHEEATKELNKRRVKKEEKKARKKRDWSKEFSV